MSKDKAGKSYWERNWQNHQMPVPIDPADKSLNNYVNLKFHSRFRDIFSFGGEETKTLLEIGGARSAWLPYFAKQFGFEVYGLDYSETGCRQAEEILLNEGVKGEVVCANFFSPPDRMLEFFDVVVSFGVAEHFEDTMDCISAFSKLMKPGAIIITIIPNMTGIVGMLQKLGNRPIFDMHVPLDRDSLSKAHEDSGLQITVCEYFLFWNLSVLNLENLQGTPFYGALVRLRSLLSKLVWSAEGRIPLPEPNRWTSPYIVCVAEKPCA